MIPEPPATDADRPQGRLARWWRLLVELVKFGTVGAVAFVVDWGLYSLLVIVPNAWLTDTPTRARILTGAVATMVAWLGNRYWTFRGKRSPNPLRELIAFALVNVGGIAIGAAVTYFVAWGLGYRSTFADHMGFLIGTALGTIFRYLMYKFAVFTKGEKPT